MTVSEGLASLALRSKWARGCLLAYVIVIVAAFPVGLAVGFASAYYALPPAYLGVFLLACVAFGLILLLGMIVTVPLWTYRAWANLHAMRVTALRFSPGWAAGSFFVPIVGLWVPFVAMRQLANRSYGEEEWHSNADVADVTSWWACYIAGLFIQFATAGITLFNTNGVIFIVAHPIVRILTSLFGIVLMIGAAWFLRRVIRDITAAQSSFAGISETFA